MPESKTYWNGEPARARRCTVVLPAHDPERHPPAAWWKHLAGATRHAVEVEYNGGVFFLDDEGHEVSEDERRAFAEFGRPLDGDRIGGPGWGWAKVTEGLGSPRLAHSSLPRDVLVVAYRDGCWGCGDVRGHASGCQVRTAELARSGAFDD